MKNKWVIILGASVLLIGLIGINLWVNKTPTRIKVETSQLSEEIMQETIITPGILKLHKEQLIYNEQERGTFAEILVKEGEEVVEGDELIRYENEQLVLESKENELQIRSLLLELDKVKKEHHEIDKAVEKNRKDELLKEEHDEISLRHKQLNIELEQLNLQKDSIALRLEDLIVYAEQSGTILEVNDDPTLIEESLIRIGSLNEVIVEGTVSEYDALKVRVNQAVVLTSEAMPDKEWKAEVSSISDLPNDVELDDLGALYPIKIKVKDKVNLKPGFRMLIEIVTSKESVNTIPINAVQQADEENYVFIIERGKAKRVEVNIGVDNYESIEITEGIKDDDFVIINPTEEIVDGMEVDTK